MKNINLKKLGFKNWTYMNFKKPSHLIHLRIVARPLAAEFFKDGETGASPKNTSKSAEVTFSDSIVASTLEGIPSDETQTWNNHNMVLLICRGENQKYKNR